MLVNKRECAALLRITLPTLDRWLRDWPEFPVALRGGPGAQWQFDPDAALAFVAEKKEGADRAKQARADDLAQFALPGIGEAEQLPAAGGARTVADLIALARLRRMQREEAVAAGRLVEADRLAPVLADVLGRLGRGLRGALRQALASAGVAPATLAEIEAGFAEQQREAVRRLEAELGSAITAPAGEPPAQERPALRLVG